MRSRSTGMPSAITTSVAPNRPVAGSRLAPSAARCRAVPGGTMGGESGPRSSSASGSRPEPQQLGPQRRGDLLPRQHLPGPFHHHPLLCRERPPGQPMRPRQGGELRGLDHQPPSRRRRGADRLAGARPGALEDVAEPQGRVLDHRQRPRPGELLRRGGQGEEQQQQNQRAHRPPHRIRDSVESISSLAVMTLLFIS